MKPFYLSEITTKDGLVHQGIFYKPEKPGKKAILWVHGLTSNFYGDAKMFGEIVDLCDKDGIGFTSFNTRGHDFITGMRKNDPTKEKGYAHVTMGAGYEKFEDCVYDIAAGVSFLVTHGFPEVIIAGHSSGANKVCYFAATQTEQAVTGVILASPISDQLGVADKMKLEEDLKFMRQLDKNGRGDALVVGRMFFPLTPKRFLSLFTPHSNEDVFDYGGEKPEMTYFSMIRKPMLIILGKSDEYTDRPVEDIKNVFDKQTKSPRYQSVIIPDANHGYDGNEKEVATVIVQWIKEI